jgi:hypothetical protein
MLGVFRNHRKRKVAGRFQLRLEVLEDRAGPSAFPLATMGDSITASYIGQFQGSLGDRSWTDQFHSLRANLINIYNNAVSGATSTNVVNNQMATAASEVKNGTVHDVVLIIGGNDAKNDAVSLSVGVYGSFINTLVSNIKTIVNTVEAAGTVHMAVATVPDIAVSPLVQSLIPFFLLPNVSNGIAQANSQIKSFCAGLHIPVIDLFNFSHLLNSPLKMGGTTTTDEFAPDFFHPATPPQGLLGNSVIKAFQLGYGESLAGIAMSDQTILDEVPISHPPGTSYFNVSPYIIYSGTKTASLLIATVPAPSTTASNTPAIASNAAAHAFQTFAQTTARAVVDAAFVSGSHSKTMAASQALFNSQLGQILD